MMRSDSGMVWRPDRDPAALSDSLPPRRDHPTCDVDVSDTTGLRQPRTLWDCALQVLLGGLLLSLVLRFAAEVMWASGDFPHSVSQDQAITKGMTQKQVQSLLGAPDSVDHSPGGTVRWYYKRKGDLFVEWKMFI